jgi:hypothetical protein
MESEHPRHGGPTIHGRLIRPRLFFLWLILALILAMGAVPAAGDAPEVVVEVVPDQVTLPPEGEIQILVVARNQGAQRLDDVHLAWFSEVPVQVTNQSPASGQLASGGVLVWALILSQPAEALVTGAVHLQVAYTWRADPASPAVPGIALGRLELAGPATEAAEKVVDVQIETTLGALTEQQPGEVFVIIKNISNTPVRVTDVLPGGPEFITFQTAGLDQDVTLEPGQSQAVPVTVRARNVVRPGKHLLLFDVHLAWERQGRDRTGNLILPHEIEVGVLGEAEILKALAVPSFLFLPGFLMVASVGLLWKLSRSEREFPLKLGDPEFWLVAITLSILMALVYPWATQVLTGARRNYLEGYGLLDVIQVWLSSILLAALAYVGVLGTRNLVSRLIDWVRTVKRQRRTPSPDDSPLSLLKKLHRQNLGVWLERVNLKIEGTDHFAFILEPPNREAERLWVGPVIVVEWLEGADVELRMQVDRQLGEKGSAATLAGLLKRGHQAGALRISWKTTSKLDKPYLADKNDIKSFEPPNFIIEQE